MEDKIRTHLESILDVYKKSLEGVTNYITESEKNMAESETQLQNAKDHKEDVETKISDLQSILGYDVSVESSETETVDT